MVTLKVVARRRAKQDALRTTPHDLSAERSDLGRMHLQALELHDKKLRLSHQGHTDDGDAITSSGHVLLETDESIIAMNQRLIRERNALIREKEVWQSQLHTQHTNLQEVLQATRLLKLKIQHNQKPVDGCPAIATPTAPTSPATL
ncbi:hypothetical protein H310_10643 [Aphanomyces invadans]|uniref:Uncharacterized protein n=1 Tax=Aphanomyces invadans TaxID=157072 RepID=A0A024TQU4_9STRA|nr:hypothetical protein H310_10643 [Aphanomyces invadans]ETV95986.1 hypothetical protein H310_10643 [Aphanomyces invadans]|eukprot:XP_008875297.1 hypothetical protein H310_10643 [Aphanomyces invadans]